MSEGVTCPECGKEYDTPRGFLSHWGHADDGNHEGGAPKEAYGELEFSEEHREGISENRIGITHSEETKQKIAEALEGNEPWNKGLTKEESESLQSTAESLSGRTLSKERVEKHAQKVRDAWERGAYDEREGVARVGEDNHFYRHGRFAGGHGPDYPVEFNQELRRTIRKRDNYRCQVCGKSPEERRLHVHHIDADKENNNHDNLVSLCSGCHKTMEFKEEQVQRMTYSTGPDAEWTLNERVVV
jgi:hypothetical protein